MAEYTVKEKMEHAIAEAAASFMTNEYVVKGAQLKCTLGSAPSLLNLPLCHGFYATGHPIIHSMDNKPMVNILPFGTCPVLGGPCVPAPVGPWLNTHEKTMIADAAPGGPLYPAVTMKSFLVCALGGLIEPKKSGQEYKAPGASSTYEGKAPANTGNSDKQIRQDGIANITPSIYIKSNSYFGRTYWKGERTPPSSEEIAIDKAYDILEKLIHSKTSDILDNTIYQQYTTYYDTLQELQKAIAKMDAQDKYDENFRWVVNNLQTILNTIVNARSGQGLGEIAKGLASDILIPGPGDIMPEYSGTRIKSLYYKQEREILSWYSRYPQYTFLINASDHREEFTEMLSREIEKANKSDIYSKFEKEIIADMLTEVLEMNLHYTTCNSKMNSEIEEIKEIYYIGRE